MEFEDHEEDTEMEATNYKRLLENSASRVKEPSPAQTNHPHGKATYKECLKNHAVGVGGHALDGCGEFMPAGPDGTLDALKCAACNCHRNFHRKDVDANADGMVFGEPFLLSHRPNSQFISYCRAPAGYLHVAPQRRMLALPSTSGGTSNQSGGGGGGGGGALSGELGRKRLRTKFTEEQKEKMLGMAERLDWRIQKNDEAAVMELCNEIGVKRRVLKVWMHNNKNTFRKEPETKYP